ncbi:MAG: amidohydrolase [Rhizobiales bacterium]|nr:amidohydrolase [Hyphomicrobiales bacterium]
MTSVTRNMPLTVANGIVATLDASARVLMRENVVVEGGLIASAGGHDVRGETLNASGGIVMPGLLNSHCHSPETLARGVVDRIIYEDWIGAVWPPLDQLTPEQIRVAVLLGCAEMLHSGTTAVVDHFRQTPMRLEAVEAAVAAYREAGMRCAIAIMVRDRSVPAWVTDKGGDISELLGAAIDTWHDPDSLITVMLAPSAPHRCTDALLRRVGEIAADRDLFMQMHVDENQSQRHEANGIYGHSSIRHLDSLGLLDRRLSLAHCVWVDDVDLSLLAGHDVTVVHNPVSNLRLGSGVAPIPEMLERGIAVTLGADGAASNDSQSMLEVMKLASLLPGTSGVSPRPTAPDILAMTTGTAAARFGMEDVGRIAPGQKADLVVFEGNDPRLHPLNDVHQQIVFAGAGIRARHVVIDGRVVVRNGKIQTFDEEALLREADEFRAFQQKKYM